MSGGLKAFLVPISKEEASIRTAEELALLDDDVYLRSSEHAVAVRVEEGKDMAMMKFSIARKRKRSSGRSSV